MEYPNDILKLFVTYILGVFSRTVHPSRYVTIDNTDIDLYHGLSPWFYFTIYIDVFYDLKDLQFFIVYVLSHVYCVIFKLDLLSFYKIYVPQ